jgi:hypothetical protein
MICETGVSHYSITTGEDLTEWAVANLEKLYAMLPVVYPDVKAITYFSMDQGSPFYNNPSTIWNNYRLSDNRAMAEKYTALMKSGSIVHTIGGSAGFTYRKIDTSEMPLYSQILFNIKIPDYKINRVEFLIDDQLIKTDTELPFSLEYNLSFASDIKARIYGSDGSLAVEKDIVLSGSTNEAIAGAYRSGFSTGMEFCQNNLSCNSRIELSIPDISSEEQCAFMDQEGNMDIPCLWIGNSLFSVKLDFHEGGVEQIRSFNSRTATDVIMGVPEAVERDPAAYAWFYGYQQGVISCLDGTLNCNEETFNGIFDNACSTYDMASNILSVPCLQIDGRLYDAELELFSLEPLLLKLTEASEH